MKTSFQNEKFWRCLTVGFCVTALVACVLSLSACGGDSPEPSQEELLIQKFRGVWRIDDSPSEPAVTVDGFFKTTDYQNFQLSIDDETYTVSGAQSPGPWPSTGVWTFTSEITDANDNTFQITRDEDLIVDVTLLSETRLKLEFTFDSGTNSGGRTSRVTGEWTFYLKK